MLMTIARASPIACLKCPQRAVNTTHYRCATTLLWVERVYRDGVCRTVLLADARGRLGELLGYYPGIGA